jgi:hypothetical protein
VTRRGGAWLAAAASVGAFAAGCFLRMNAAYGPFNLSPNPADWMVLWDLWHLGQIAPRIVVQSALLGAAAAALPWGVFWLLRRAPAR